MLCPPGATSCLQPSRVVVKEWGLMVRNTFSPMEEWNSLGVKLCHAKFQTQKTVGKANLKNDDVAKHSKRLKIPMFCRLPPQFCFRVFIGRQTKKIWHKFSSNKIILEFCPKPSTSTKKKYTNKETPTSTLLFSPCKDFDSFCVYRPPPTPPSPAFLFLFTTCRG